MILGKAKCLGLEESKWSRQERSEGWDEIAQITGGSKPWCGLHHSAHLIGTTLFYLKYEGKSLDRFCMEVILSDHSNNCVENSVPEATSTEWLVRGKGREPYVGWTWLWILTLAYNLGKLFNIPDLCLFIYLKTGPITSFGELWRWRKGVYVLSWQMLKMVAIVVNTDSAAFALLAPRKLKMSGTWLVSHVTFFKAHTLGEEWEVEKEVGRCLVKVRAALREEGNRLFFSCVIFFPHRLNPTCSLFL